MNRRLTGDQGLSGAFLAEYTVPINQKRGVKKDCQQFSVRVQGASRGRQKTRPRSGQSQLGSHMIRGDVMANV